MPIDANAHDMVEMARGINDFIRGRADDDIESRSGSSDHLRSETAHARLTKLCASIARFHSDSILRAAADSASRRGRCVNSREETAHGVIAMSWTAQYVMRRIADAERACQSGPCPTSLAANDHERQFRLCGTICERLRLACDAIAALRGAWQKSWGATAHSGCTRCREWKACVAEPRRGIAAAESE